MNSGTSPAAAVTGAMAARLLQAGVPDPMQVKAVLINSADTWQSGTHAHPRVRGNGRGCRTDDDAAGHGPYPYGARYDRTYGWGYLNGDEALRQASFVVGDALSPGASHCFASELAPWQKVTLVWQRRVGTCRTCGNSGWFRLSRLDLALFDATGGPRPLDRDDSRHLDDNVLQVSNGRGAQTAARRAAIVRVHLPATAIDGAVVEPYALAGAGPLTRMTRCPPALRVGATGQP